MSNTYHKTAIARRKPSAPARELHARGLLTGRVLDYGAGRGADAAAYGLESYEPNGGPSMPEGQFDTITCTFVLNVVDAETGAAILADIRSRLAEGGRAYVTVRRDLRSQDPAGYTTGTGSFQRWVELPYPTIINRTGGFETYVLTDCDTCDRVRWHGFGPSHNGHECCRMKASIASGGDRAHCTCAGCF